MKTRSILLFLLVSLATSDFVADNHIYKLTTHSKRKLEAALATSNHASKECKGCFILFEAISKILSAGYGVETIQGYVSYICTFIMSDDVCTGLVKNYTPAVLTGVLKKIVEPSQFCQNIQMCNGTYSEIDQMEYAREILANKPKGNLKPTSTVPSIKFFHISDIHTDFLYKEGTSTVCDKPLCCREENGVNPDPKLNAGYWGGNGPCDLPERTLNLMAEIIGKDQPDFLIITGDNPAHDPWNDTGEEAFMVAENFKKFIKSYGYDKPIYNTLGNHELVPIDNFNIFRRTEYLDKLLNDYGNLWKEYLSEEAYKTFVNHGYYATDHEQNGSILRIISLNCMSCDVLNFYLIGDPTDPLNMFSWLENELSKAEQRGVPVLIATHIPFGDVTSLGGCSMRYKILMDRFSETVIIQLSGHTHYDEFKVNSQVLTEEHNPIGAQWIVPSLTTYSKRNISYREFILAKDFYPLDYFQMRLDVKKANLSPEVKPSFDLIYKATEVFD